MLLTLLLSSCARDLAPVPEPVDPRACFAELAQALSTDEMEGRGLGTEGVEKAAELIARELSAAGFEAPEGGYSQPFEVTVGVSLGEDNRLSLGGEAAGEGSWTPLGFSSDGAFEGPLVFAGFGIQAGEHDYDDYAGLDVAGKVVLAMRYEPGETDPDSPFAGTRPSRFSDLRLKAMRARELGAAALVMVSPARDGEEPDKLPVLKPEGPVSRAGLPVIQITRAEADRWLAAADTDLASLKATIDAEYKPASLEIPGVTVAGAVDLVPEKAEARNLIGVLPGEGALAAESIFVGAHYDHLGYGGRGSMRPDSEEIHNGADDNASGTAAAICGARLLARGLPEGDRRTLVIGLFAAEEVGLGGSGYYVQNPALPLEQTAAMVNLDMVGRVRDGQLSAMGTETAPEWVDLLTAPAAAAGLTLTTGGDGYGPSDQTSFYDRGVPVIHLFSGAHEQYHTPEDDYETLNLEGGGQVVTLLAGALEGLVTAPQKLTYVKASSAPTMGGDSRGYGAYLGTIPDYAAMMAEEGGVLLGGVRADGPADRAGLQGGDTIVGMAGAEIQNLYDMTFVLRDHRPGETIEIVVLRGGEEVSLQATLGRRAAEPESPHGGPHGGSPHGDFEVGAEEGDGGEWRPLAGEAVPGLLHEEEAHLADLRQLTFGGENAEGYFSPDGRSLIFQRTPPEGGCDQQYTLDLTTGEVTLLSSGEGRTTCGYYAYPGGERLIYATTEGGSAECPAPPDRSQGYVWPIYGDYEMVWQSPGGEPEVFLPSPAYDAEATVCMADGRVIFTSTRDGDLDLYVVNPDGSGLRRMTDTPGYDGGAFFTPDCSQIVWRASRPEGGALTDYQDLLKQGLVRPGALELYIMNVDGSNVRQLTDNGAANFAPYPAPDGSYLLFSSNLGGGGREFDIFKVPADGSGQTERVTHSEGFDGFPMFSPDGRWLVFASNRATAAGESDTNLFIARWVE
jgi:Tol biopolymer transport system component